MAWNEAMSDIPGVIATRFEPPGDAGRDGGRRTGSRVPAGRAR